LPLAWPVSVDQLEDAPHGWRPISVQGSMSCEPPAAYYNAVKPEDDPITPGLS